MLCQCLCLASLRPWTTHRGRRSSGSETCQSMSSALAKRSASLPASRTASPFSPAARRTAGVRLPPCITTFDDSTDLDENGDGHFLSQRGSPLPRCNLAATTLGQDSMVPPNTPPYSPHATPPRIPPEERGFRLDPEDLHFEYPLAEGSYGVIWKARAADKAVAVKVQRLPCNEDEQANLLCELTILQGLSHPRLVHYEGAAILEASRARERSDWAPLLEGPRQPTRRPWSPIHAKEKVTRSRRDKLDSSNTEGGREERYKAGGGVDRDPSEEQRQVQQIIQQQQRLQQQQQADADNCPLILIGMEYCTRGSLRQCWQAEQMPWALKVRTIADTAEGLAFLHGQGIIHRDLKTTNILVDVHWRAKICDHSFAVALRNPEIAAFDCGTMEFVSPEIPLNLPYDGRCDIYSLGIVICELAAEREPGERGFLIRRAEEFFDIHVDHIQQSVLADCPTSFLNLATQCVQHEATYRPSAREVYDWCQSLVNELGGGTGLLAERNPSPAPPISPGPLTISTVYPTLIPSSSRQVFSNGYSHTWSPRSLTSSPRLRVDVGL